VAAVKQKFEQMDATIAVLQQRQTEEANETYKRLQLDRQEYNRRNVEMQRKFDSQY